MAKYISFDEATGKKIYPETISETAGAADGDKIVSTDPVTGLIDDSFFPATIGQELGIYDATEDIGAGKFVQRYDVGGGVSKIRAADKTGKPADGFIKDAVLLGQSVKVLELGQRNTAMAGLVIGEYYFLGTAGAVVLGAGLSWLAGDVIQKVGKAVNAGVLSTMHVEATTVQ